MRALLFTYCLGIMAASLMPNPGTILSGMLILGPAIGLMLASRPGRRPALRPIIIHLLALVVGVGWHAWWAQSRLDAQLPPALEGVDLKVSGEVVSLPRRSGITEQVVFRIDQGPQDFERARVRLNDYQGLGLAPGQRWQLRVRLKRPHGLLNPGGFDAEAWLLQQGIAATGYIRPGQHNKLLTHSGLSLESLRYRLRQRLSALGTQTGRHGVILALTLGDRSELSGGQWDFFSRTGTNHLFVISGLHIGMAALFGYVVAAGIYWLMPLLANVLPRQQGAALSALATALVYSLLAGFTLPTQRAVVMLAAVMLGRLCQRRVSAGLRLLLALAVVLTLNPLAAMSAGFWLSFTAVAVLLSCMQPPPALAESDSGKLRLRRLYGRLIRPQWLVFVGLSLPLALWMQQLSLLAPLVNLIAIPVVGTIVVPLCLLAALLAFPAPDVTLMLLQLVAQILTLLFDAMTRLLEISGEFALLTFTGAALPAYGLAAVAVILLLAPRGFGPRWLALPLLLPLLVPRQQELQPSGFALHVLDVGQGLAVVLKTADHALLYDTGAGLDEMSNSGRRVIVPALRRLGIERLDRVVISHGDNDHAGGLPGVLSQIPVGQVLGSLTLPPVGVEVDRCREGMSWHWDGLDFRFLHPSGPITESNDDSCVLLIDNGSSRVLLPGDIEAAAERRLAVDYGNRLKAELLLAPHHGSNSSSSYPLIKLVEPDYVVFAAGYANGFGHPSPKIVARYRALGARTFNTSTSGMLTFYTAGDGSLVPAPAYRLQQPRYWRGRPK